MFSLLRSEELKTLAGLFPKDKPLYAVGGCVRDGLRGVEFYDIDLAGALLPEQLKDLLDGTPFQVHSASLRLGTVVIKGGDRHYEYTTFRIDSYPAGSGEHTPSKVEFTDDLYTDACRRDFKCNALYYDILKDEIIDPLDGRKDIEDKILSTTVDPKKVLGEDGLRIMRMMRFVSVLGYKIQDDTYDWAVKLADNLRDISVERIRDELDKLLVGEHCYEALKLMNQSGVLKIILPELALNDKVAQKPQFHKYDVLEHIFKVVENCPPDIRLAGLFHDIAKAKCMHDDGNTYMHACVGEEMTRRIMKKYRYPIKQTERIARLVGGHMFDVNGNARDIKYRRFIAKNYDIIDDMTALFDADSIGTGYYDYSRTASKMRDIYRQMLKEKVAFNTSMLAVRGEDLKELGYSGKELGEELKRLVGMSVDGMIANERRSLLKEAQKQRLKSENGERK